MNAHIWVVELHPDFAKELEESAAGDPSLRREIVAAAIQLERFGPTLGRPLVDTVKGSRYPNMKELRVRHRGAPWRILFAFDPARRAVLLVIGNKASDKRWYGRSIAVAEARFADHLERTKRDRHGHTT